MIKNIKKYAITALIILLPVSSFAADTIYQGKVYLRDGRVIDAKNIEIRGLTTTGLCNFTINSQSYKLNANQIASLDFLKVRVRDGYINSNSQIHILLKNGRKAIATNAGLYTNTKITFKDEFTGKMESQQFFLDGSTEKGLSAADIIRIDFTGSGTMMWSTTSEAFFPPDFLFDPYHGNPLVPGNPDNHNNASLNQTSWVNPQKNTTTTSQPDTGHTQSHTPANLEETALNYAKTSINPLSTSKEAKNALNRLQQAAEQTFGK